jgi:hypothetical protein
VLVERVSKRPISSLETGENGYVSRVDSKSMQGSHKRTNLLQVSSEISPRCHLERELFILTEKTIDKRLRCTTPNLFFLSTAPRDNQLEGH